MSRLQQILHNPTITWMDEEENLHVDLLQLAHHAGAPLTAPSIAKISLIVQREFRLAFPNSECRVDVTQQTDRARDQLIIEDFDRDLLP